MDTSAYYALIDTRDDNHEASLLVRDQLVDERWRIFTSNFVIAETHALTLSRLGRRVALQVVEAIDNSSTTVVRVTAKDEARARSILRDYGDKDFSLTDATSFAVTERLRISAAFSFDCHFMQYGIPLIR